MMTLILNIVTLSYFVRNLLVVLQFHVCGLFRRDAHSSLLHSKRKRKCEHRDSTCQIVTHLKMPLEKKIKPTLSNVNKWKYNSFDLLCSPFHQLF